MKRFTTAVLASFLMLGAVSTTSLADAVKGQKLYLKKLKKTCGITGAEMAAKHTQMEWLEIKNTGKLETEIKTICPKVKSVKERYQEHLFDFFHNYASDSGNVPSC